VVEELPKKGGRTVSRRRALSALPRFRGLVLDLLVANERQSPLEFSDKVGAFSGDMHRLARLFSKPSVQLRGRRFDIATLFSDWHPL